VRKVSESAGSDAKKLSLDARKVIDKAARKGAIHKNKAARLKSRIARISKKTSK
jgi:small subunit ribosomal protein S20